MSEANDQATPHHIDHVLAVVEGLATPADGDVSQSWKRSANAHHVDPGSRDPPRIITSSEIRAAQEASSQFLEVARVELDQLYKIVRPTHYVILLCDKDGMVIEHRGEESDAAQFRHWGVWLGGVWSEEAEGTNGIGTCLAEQRSITVHRSQHFRVRHISLSCSGAPIFDGNGDLLGVLDVSSIDPELSDRAHALTGALTVASARAIEERLFRKQFCREWILAIWSPGDSSPAMLISVDRERRIVGADRSARLVLTRSEHDRLEQGVGLWAFFEQNDELFRHMDRGDILTEVRPRRSAEFWPAIITPPEPALSRCSRSESEELRLRPRLDTLAINRLTPKPARARGGLSPAMLRRIRDYVDSHLDHHIDIESLAATAELSPYHFARTFKQTEGTTPHMFVLERRLAKARELLTRPDLSLADVALASGFADQSHFSRRFRQAVGISPGQFRKLQD